MELVVAKARAMTLALALGLGLLILGCGGGSGEPAESQATGGPQAEATTAPLATPTPRLHVVVPGDNLSALCDELVPELPLADCLDRSVQLNGLASAGQIQVGQELVLPEDPAARASLRLAQGASTPLPTVPAGPRDTPTPVADRCGAPANPYNFSFCDTGGSVIIAPPEDICGYLVCSELFWQQRGYVVQCADGVFSKAGGTSAACLEHGGPDRALMTP